MVGNCWSSAAWSILVRDNQGAIALSKNPEFHKQTKHICLHYHYVHKAVGSGIVQIPYVPTADMAASILTKALGRDKHDCFSLMFGVSAMPLVY